MIDKKFADLFAQNSQVAIDVAEREIVLTYVLKVLDDAGLLKALAFKGGTCLRKCVYGKETRFSVDLDFTSDGTGKPDDVILGLVAALGKPAYGLTFSIGADDFYVAEDGMSCGATVVYRHAWNEANFKLDVSLREEPSLDLVSFPLQAQPYFKYLEFKPFPVRSFRFEELLGEKIRAASQRVRSRDLYDLAKAADRPLKARLIRALAVIKCWNARDAFAPDRFMEKLRSSYYDWDDLRRLVRRSEKIDPEALISTCEERYGFLLDITEGEKRLTADAKRHSLKTLPGVLLREASR